MLLRKGGSALEALCMVMEFGVNSWINASSRLRLSRRMVVSLYKNRLSIDIYFEREDP